MERGLEELDALDKGLVSILLLSTRSAVNLSISTSLVFTNMLTKRMLTKRAHVVAIIQAFKAVSKYKHEILSSCSQHHVVNRGGFSIIALPSQCIDPMRVIYQFPANRWQT